MVLKITYALVGEDLSKKECFTCGTNLMLCFRGIDDMDIWITDMEAQLQNEDIGKVNYTTPSNKNNSCLM